MDWQPNPYPDMSQIEYDSLASYMLANGWGDLPAIIIDDENNLIDGYKRHQVARDLGFPSVPAFVIETSGLPDEERRAKYEALRRRMNSSQPLLIDEILAWLNKVR